MTVRRAKSIIIGSAPGSIADGLFIGIVGGILFALLNLVIPEDWIFVELGVSMVLPAAVMARHRYGVVPIWIAVFPPLLIILRAACTTDILPCNSLGTALAASVGYGTLGFVFGRVFAWKRQRNSRSETYTLIGKSVTGPGFIVLLIALYLPRSEMWIYAYPNAAVKELLFLLSSITVFAGVLSYLWGKYLIRGSRRSKTTP